MRIRLNNAFLFVDYYFMFNLIDKMFNIFQVVK